MEPDRCPQCGALLAIVGRLHLCRKDARLEGAFDRRGLGLGKALERPKPRLIKPDNRPVNRAVNGPVNAAVNKIEKRKAYMRELMRARRAQIAHVGLAIDLANRPANSSLVSRLDQPRPLRGSSGRPGRAAPRSRGNDEGSS